MPRQPAEFGLFASLLESERIPFVRRSRNETCTPATEVLLVDTLGELLDFYAASDVAFVGGSLVTIGGHNLLEPAALGLPAPVGYSADLYRELEALAVFFGVLSIGLIAWRVMRESYFTGVALAKLVEGKPIIPRR